MFKSIYHGSEKIIKTPVFGMGKPYNDYGLGFYCTEDIKMAKEWAVSKDKNGYANCYKLDCRDLDILYLNSDNYCILNWLAVLLENREFDAPSGLAFDAKKYIRDNFIIDYNKYDIICGYRADDSYFSFAQDFLNGTISYRQLSNAMKLGKLGEQIVLKSKFSFEKIIFSGYETSLSEDWYPRKIHRDNWARRQYFDAERSNRKRGDIYITQILDEEMKSDDPRLR